MLSQGVPARGFGSLRGGPGVVGLIFDHTAATGVVAQVKGQTGFAATTGSAGVVALTFPKNLKHISGIAALSGTSANRDNMVTDVNLTAGTANLRFAGDPGTQRVYLTLFIGE